MARKRRAAGRGARLGARVAPKAGKAAGKAALKLGKGEAKLARRAFSSSEPASSRFLKYGFFTLIGFAIGSLVARFASRDGGASYTDTTGHHTPDPGSPAGQRGETWGSGTPLGTSAQHPEDPNRTGSERAYSDPSSGPLVGEQHRGQVGEIPTQQEELENRIRTRIGEDPRTMEMPRVNVEVNDGVAELRGPAPSEDAKLAAGEIAAQTPGVREVRNLLTVSS